MGRPKRIDLGGYVYDVLNRSNGRTPIFRKAGDYAAFDADARRADDVFDRAAGMKSPPVEARSSEEWGAHEMARIGANALETDGTILPPCLVPRSIAGRNDVLLIGAAINRFSLPERRFFGTTVFCFHSAPRCKCARPPAQSSGCWTYEVRHASRRLD